MTQPGRDQHESGLPIREVADHAGASADLPHNPFHHVVGFQLPPVNPGEGVVCEGLRDLLLHEERGLVELRLIHLFHDLSGLHHRSLASFLSVNRFQHARHFAHLVVGRVAEHVAIQMHRAALPACLGKNSLAASTKPLQASEMNSCAPLKPRSFRYLTKLRQPSRSSFSPSATPRICR